MKLISVSIDWKMFCGVTTQRQENIPLYESDSGTFQPAMTRQTKKCHFRVVF